jgi:hypothetical protein
MFPDEWVIEWVESVGFWRCDVYTNFHVYHAFIGSNSPTPLVLAFCDSEFIGIKAF